MDILDPTASASQRPLDGGALVVLLSYPVSLSAAAAASVWTWLALAVAGGWLWRVISHQSASAARIKEVDASSAASHLLPSDAADCFLKPQRVPQTDLPCSRCSIGEIEDGVEEEIQLGCSRSRHGALDKLTSQFPSPKEVLSLARKTMVVYFEGHGGYCRESDRVGEDEDDQAVNASSSSSGRWFWDVTGTVGDSDFHVNCLSKVVRCWDDARVQEEEYDAPDGVIPFRTTTQMSDLGCHRFQDWRVINGNVVRFWDT